MNNMDKFQKYYAKRNKADSRSYMLRFPACDFLERQNYLISGFLAKEHKGTSGMTEIFYIIVVVR